MDNVVEFKKPEKESDYWLCMQCDGLAFYVLRSHLFCIACGNMIKYSVLVEKGLMIT